jgi:hypothetical protein
MLFLTFFGRIVLREILFDGCKIFKTADDPLSGFRVVPGGNG